MRLRNTNSSLTEDGHLVNLRRKNAMREILAPLSPLQLRLTLAKTCQPTRLQILLRACVVFQICIPERQGHRIGIAQNIFGLLPPSWQERSRSYEGHVIRPLDEHVILVAGGTQLERFLMPVRIRNRPQTILRSG